MKKAFRVALLCVVTLLLTLSLSGAYGHIKASAAPCVGVKQVLDSAQIRKDETVYAFLHSDGSVGGITVSSLVVTEVDGNYTDRGNYTEITPMSTGVVPVFGDGCVSFDVKASPSGFRYAGGLSGGELPVTVAMDYYLNGEEVDASALAGATGEVSISLKISPNPNCAELYAFRFLCCLEIPLDLTRCSGVVCSGGTAAVNGDTKTISAAVLPGASAAVTVSFKAADFSMDGIALTLTPFSYASLDLSAFGLSAESLSSSAEYAETLDKQLSEHVEGLKKLCAASEQLSSGMGTVVSGGDKLSADYTTLKNSVLSLISSIESTLPTLPQARRTALTLVISQLKTGLDDFGTALAQYRTAVTDSAGYLGELSDGLSGLGAQSDGVYGGFTALAEGLGTAADLLAEEGSKPLYGFADPTAKVESLQFILETDGIQPELRTYTPSGGDGAENILNRFLDLFR